MSEYGFQGFPDMLTINSFTDPEDRKLTSPVLKVHQKHPAGMELIDLYMKRDYPATESFEEYVYLSQLCQANGINLAVEAHRRSMPYCMGTLYWQLNDCWPVISWSGMDYYSRPKALQYFITKAYADVLLSFEPKNGILKLYGISDRKKAVKGFLELCLMDFDGVKIWTKKMRILLKPNASRVIYVFSPDELPAKPQQSGTLIKANITDDKGKTVATQIHYFQTPANLALKDYKITKNITQNGDTLIIRLSTKRLVKNVGLSFKDTDGTFSDNYFDLLPSGTKELFFIPAQPVKKVLPTLKIITLNDILLP